MFSQVVDKAPPARSMHHRATPGKDAFAKFNYICGEGYAKSLLGLTADAAPFANLNGNICALRHRIKHNECSADDLGPDSLTRQNPDQGRKIGMALHPSRHPSIPSNEPDVRCWSEANSACILPPQALTSSRSYAPQAPTERPVLQNDRTGSALDDGAQESLSSVAFDILELGKGGGGQVLAVARKALTHQLRVGQLQVRHLGSKSSRRPLMSETNVRPYRLPKSWALQQHPLPWHSSAGGGGVHNITSRHRRVSASFDL